MRQLKVIMAEKGMTVQELSELTKLSKTTISKLRQDGTTTKMKNLYLIAEKLNVEPKDLLD